jgi:hypothetical protein
MPRDINAECHTFIVMPSVVVTSVIMPIVVAPQKTFHFISMLELLIEALGIFLSNSSFFGRQNFVIFTPETCFIKLFYE